MNDSTQELLRKVEQNDDSFTSLSIGRIQDIGIDFDRLGRAIATNSNISLLQVYLDALIITSTTFFDGLKGNISIDHLIIKDGALMEHGAGSDILRAYQENNNHLKALSILQTDIQQNQGYNIITTTLQCCTNLKEINLFGCNITVNQLVPMVEVMRGLRSLVELYLNNNNIGNAGCEALATLLNDPNCNLQEIQISHNRIDIEGANAIVNSLINNTKLRKLHLTVNNTDRHQAAMNFYTLLCNRSSINSIYSSNHTLHYMSIYFYSQLNDSMRHDFSQLQCMNKVANKSYVAAKKILRYHPIIDMEPLFILGLEDDERNLKALPYIIDWFDKASAAVNDEEDSSVSSGDSSDSEEEDYHVEEKRLSAIFQFARAMPLHFVPSTPDMILLHEDMRDQLEDEKTKLERQIDSMLKTKKDLEDRIKAKDETIENLRGLSDSISNKVDDKKRKRGN